VPYEFRINFRKDMSKDFTVEKAVKVVAVQIVRAFETLSSWSCPDGLPLELGGVRIEQVYLIGVDHVSRGSIQPVLAIEFPDVAGRLDFAPAA